MLLAAALFAFTSDITAERSSTVEAADFAGICSNPWDPIAVGVRARAAGYELASREIQREVSNRLSIGGGAILHREIGSSHVDILITNQMEEDGFSYRSCHITVTGQSLTNEGQFVADFSLNGLSETPEFLNEVRIGAEWEDREGLRTLSYYRISEEGSRDVAMTFRIPHLSQATEFLTIVRYGH